MTDSPFGTAPQMAQDMLDSMPPDDQIAKMSGGHLSGERVRDALQQVAAGVPVGEAARAMSAPPENATSRQRRDVAAAKLVAQMNDALYACNWQIGELAANWMPLRPQMMPKVDPIAYLAKLVGLTPAGLEIRLKVWDRFHATRADYPNCNWAHFQQAMQWDDRIAYASLQWADEMCANIAEQGAWVRAHFHGEFGVAATESSSAR